MAETLTIEIPIEAVDKTSAGVQSATRSLTAFEQRFTQFERRLDRLGRVHDIEVDLDDNASSGLSAVSDRAEALDGVAPSVDVGVSNSASETIAQVQDEAENLDGTSADAALGADDGATPVVQNAADAVEAFDGASGSADIGVADNATPVVSAAKDEVEAFGGASGSGTVGANDNASPVIDSVIDKAAAWDGSVWTATVSIVDAVTSPLGSIMDMARNPITQAGAMLGVTVGLNDTINTYKSFESMMSQVSAISGATGSELEAMTAKAKEMGATTKFTATEAGEAFSYMAMAGWKTGDMLGGIEGIMNLAAASGESLGSVSDIVTDALTAFGLSADKSGHFADVLAAASSNANTNVGMLGESFKYVAPVAGAMNYSVEDTSLALGLMANASVKGSMAGTALKTALANMASPTDSMATAMEKYGISLTNTDGSMKSLGEVIGNLRSSLGGLSETEQTAAASTIFGKEAMAGMLAIINASEADYNKLSNAIYNADGAAQQMADTMLDNLEGSLTLMQSAVDGVKTSFGERLAPYLAGVANMITDAMPGAEQALTNLMDFVDGKATGIKRSIDSMTGTEAWKNADVLGKVNIAWDSLIAQPFLDWAGSDGKDLISSGIGALFSDAIKILPGGQQAGLTSWLSAGLLAKGSVTAINGIKKIATTLAPIGSAIKGIGTAAAEAGSIGGFISSIGEMIPMAGKVGLAAAAITAAVAGIAIAIDNYNRKTINSNLADHFGDIELSAKEVEEVAGGILNAKYLVNVETILNSTENAKKAREEAQAALDANNELMWKATITSEFVQVPENPVSPFVTAIQELLDGETDSNGLFYMADVEVHMNPNGEDNSELVSSLVEFANAAVESAEGEDLQEYAKEVAMKIQPEGGADNTALVESLVEFANGVVSGASGAELDDYTNSVLVNLTPEEGENFLSALSKLTGEMTSQELTIPPVEKTVGVRLTPEMQEEYSNNIDTFIREKISELESETYAAHIGVQTFLGGTDEGVTLTDKIEEWARADSLELDGLSNDLKTAVESALRDGVMTVDEATVINELQNKMNAITGRWQQAQKQAHMDWIEQEYGSLSGEALTADTVSSIVSSLEEQRTLAAQETQSAYETFMTYLNAANSAGRLGSENGLETLETYKGLAGQAVRNQKATDMMNSMDFISDTFEKAYGSQLKQNYAAGKDQMATILSNLSNTVTEAPGLLADDLFINSDVFNAGNGKGWFGIVSDADQASMAKMWEGMKPTADQYASLIDQYTQMGQEVPKNVMESFNRAMEIGAASGDSDAAWQVYANAIAQSGDQALIDAVGEIAANGDLGDEFSKAWERATAAVTDEPVELDGLLAEVKDFDVSVDSSPEELSEKVKEALEIVGAGADSVQVEGTDIEIQLGNVDINDDDAMGKVAEALGMTVDQIRSYATPGDAEVDLPMTIRIPQDEITVDTEALQESVSQVASEASQTDVAEVETSAHVTVGADGGVDASGAKTAADDAVDEAFSETHDTTGSTDVTIEQTNNSAEVYEQVGNELQGAFGSAIHVNASAVVTIAWSISNPSKSISFSDSGSGSVASVSASFNAAGGQINDRILSWLGEEGTEYVIPTVPARRARGIALWEQAGMDLGVIDPDGTIAGHAVGGVVGPFGEEAARRSVIPLFDDGAEQEQGVWSTTGQQMGIATSEDRSEGQGVSVNANAQQGQQLAGDTPVQIQVDMSPVIKIEGDGMDANKVFEVMQERIRELADTLGDEIGERMGRIFANMPVITEA